MAEEEYNFIKMTREPDYEFVKIKPPPVPTLPEAEEPVGLPNIGDLFPRFPTRAVTQEPEPEAPGFLATARRPTPAPTPAAAPTPPAADVDPEIVSDMEFRLPDISGLYPEFKRYAEEIPYLVSVGASNTLRWLSPLLGQLWYEKGKPIGAERIQNVFDEAVEYWDKRRGKAQLMFPNYGIEPTPNKWWIPRVERLPDVPARDILAQTVGLGAAVYGPIKVGMGAGRLAVEEGLKLGLPRISRLWTSLYARPFFRDILSGMIGGALLGEGEVEKTMENMALFGVFEAAGYATKIPEAIRKSEPYRRATIKQRGLALQTFEETLHRSETGMTSKGLRDPYWARRRKLKPAEIQRIWANPTWWKAMQREGPVDQKIVEDILEKPIEKAMEPDFVMVKPKAKAYEPPARVKGPEEPVVSSKGEPFRTERGAMLNVVKAQKKYGIKDWTPVPVEGGFGLMPTHKVAWKQSLEEFTERSHLEGRRLADIADKDLAEAAKGPGMEPFIKEAGGDLRKGIANFISDRVEAVKEMGGIVHKELAKKKATGEPRTRTITAKHYREVAKALKAGYPVPPEAYKHYPSLKGAVVPAGAAKEVEVSTPTPAEGIKKPVGAPGLEVEPVGRVEPEAPEVKAEAPVIGQDSKGQDLRAGDRVEVSVKHRPLNYKLGQGFEVVGVHPSRPDILKVRIVGQKRQYNVPASKVRKLVAKVVKPAPAPKKKWKTVIGWFQINPIWDRTLPGETNNFHVKNSGVRGLVSKKFGLPWDELETKAKEDGLLTEDQDWQDLYRMLEEEIARVKAGKEPRKLGDITDLEKEVQKQLARDEEAWIAEQATKVEQVSYNDLDLQPGDRLNTPTPEGDSEWWTVTDVAKDGSKATLQSGEKEMELQLFDMVELVGGDAFGIDRAADRPKPTRVTLQLKDDQIIPVLNSLESKLINILNDDLKLTHAIVKVDKSQANIIDKELWLSNEAQLRYGLRSQYDKVKWAIELVNGDASGNRVYDIQRPYGYLTFDLDNKTLSLWANYEDTISSSLTIMVQPDLDKERTTKTKIMRDVLNQQPNRTIPNELLQNAFDAMPLDRAWDSKVVKYKVDSRYIDDKRATVLTFEDNGWGMSPDVFAFKYLKIGAEGKPSEVAKGGYGAANAVLLYFPNRIKVVTTAWVKENKKYGENNPLRYERGQTERGRVLPGATKMRITLDASREEMYAGLAGRAKVPMKIEKQDKGEVDRDAPTGMKYEAIYTDTDEGGWLKVNDDHLARGFKNYVQDLRDKGVVIQEGSYGEPDNITHTKSFDDLEPAELVVPKKTIKAHGSNIDIYFLNVGKYGAYRIFGKYRISQNFYNKGLPLQIPPDNISNIMRVPFEPEFKLYVNFNKTPKVDSDDYPFINNRTQVLNKVGEKIAAEVNKVLQRMTDDYMTGQQRDFDQAMKQSIDLEGVTVFLPYREKADLDAATKEVNNNKELFRSYAKVFNSFNKFLEEVGLSKVNFVITVDPRLHGYKTNPDETEQEIYAINPFSMTTEYMEKDRFKKAVEAGEDPLDLKGRNVSTTLLHEYTHKYIKGHDSDFAGTLDELLTVFDPFRLSLVAREAYEIYKEYDTRIAKLEETFQELGKGGLLIDVGSPRNLNAEYEPARIKGSSKETPLVGAYSKSRIQYDLFGEHQEIETGEEVKLSPEDLLKRTFPDASPGQIQAMLEDPKLRNQVAKGSISTALAEDISRKYGLAKSATQKEMFPKEAKGQGDLFDLSEKDVGDAITEGGPPVGLSVRAEARKPEGKPFKSASDEVQARVEASRGAPKEALWTRFVQLATELKNRATREYEHLPKTKEFAELRNALLRLTKQRGVVSQKTMRELRDVVNSLNVTDYTDFAWKVILDDLIEDLSLQRENGVTDDKVGLPYGYTPETLEADHKALNEHIKDNKEIQAALKKRADFWKRLRRDYIKAMKIIGFNVTERLQRENYFRHQVLQYVEYMGLYGTGKRLRTPSYRSFLRPRTGSAADINADYIQAEHEVVAQMLYDIEIAKTIHTVNKEYNIQDQLKYEAMISNDAKIMPFFQAMADAVDVPPDKEPPTAEKMYNLILNRKMAIGFDKLGKLAAEGELPVGKDHEWDWLVQELAENWLENKAKKKAMGKEWTSADREVLSPEAGQKLLQYAAYILKEHGGEPGSGAAATIFKGIKEKRDSMKEILGDAYVDWKDLIPEGYTLWQPWEGTTFFMAHSVSETIAKRLMEDALASIGITKDDLRQVLARGARRREFVVKQEVADTLNSISRPRDRGALGKVHAYAIRRWKIWQLVSPRRFSKYNIRNLTGDADALFVGSPKAFKKSWQSVKELYDLFILNQKPTETLSDWLYRGGWGATLQAQEMGEFKTLEPYIKSLEEKGISAKTLLPKGWRQYWKFVRLSTDFREAVLRYAAYLDALEEMQGTKDGMPLDYRASIPEEIQGLSDIRDRAFFLSNDLLGAYDRVSVMGQELRERYFPFWSWKAVNFVRYIRFWRNAWNSPTFAQKVGRKALGTAAKSPFIAYRIGKLLLKAFALWGVILAVNALVFPREEEDLPAEIRGRPHLVFGRDDEGKVQYFPRIGALADNLEWFGLDAMPYYINMWMRGRMTMKEIAADMAKSPVNVVVQGGIPFIKLGGELLTRQALFPDAFKPRTIRDRGLHIARAFGLENEYMAIMDKPSLPYYESAKGALIYTIDPFQAAYADIMDEKTRYMKRIGKYGQGFHLSDRGNALYNARLALRYNDMDAAMKYMAEYLNMGGTLRGLRRSLEAMHPLSQLNQAEKVEFVLGLDEEGQSKFVKALKFYEELVTATPKEEKVKTRLEYKGTR